MSRRRWLLVLGASSGIGAGCARVFARAGYGILGVHLDRRSSMPRVEALRSELEATGAEVHLFNRNAADREARAEVVEEIQELLQAHGERVDVLVHSLAFGSLGPFTPRPGRRPLRERQLSMTFEVMGASLAWWARDLVLADMLGLPPVSERPAPGPGSPQGGRIFALTSAGTHKVWRDYGPVSVAKAALDAVVRQLAVELAPRNVTANSILAGVTDTPALRAIPGHEAMVDQAEARNPGGRLTLPEDVGQCLLALSQPGTHWMTGNIIRVDGGEDIAV